MWVILTLSGLLWINQGLLVSTLTVNPSTGQTNHHLLDTESPLGLTVEEPRQENKLEPLDPLSNTYQQHALLIPITRPIIHRRDRTHYPELASIPTDQRNTYPIRGPAHAAE